MPLAWVRENHRVKMWIARIRYIIRKITSVSKTAASYRDAAPSGAAKFVVAYTAEKVRFWASDW